MENDKWKTEYRSKNYSVGPPFFIHSDFDAEVTGYTTFWREGVSKNNLTCENAVARK